MPLHRPFAMLAPLLAIALSLVGATPARAQVLGPVQGLPNMQVPVRLPDIAPVSPLHSVDDLLRGPLALTRKLQIDALRRSEPRRVDVDPHGAPILRGEFLATGLSSAQRDALQALGFAVDRETPADATLGLDFVVLHDTRGRRTASAMRALQQAAPDAAFTYQHLYLPAGNDDVAGATTSAAPSSSAPSQRVGLIDGGVDAADPALVRASIERHGCSTANPSKHGTAVAARLVAGDPDTLYAADLWCGDAVGGATSNLVDALAWMARERVAVINISLVGPDNPVLARAVQAMIARGHVLVSAVGNDGPAAPPLYPAAYPNVIGVGGVDARDRVLPESGSGDQVDFCASGVVGSGRNALRGTSFAAPIVARKASQLLGAPRAGAAAQVQQHLIGEARRPGGTGRDPRCGYGLLSP
ncbi:S8 family serine peptidase [Rhodanobacter sp. B2A1Ga4]|uniref:S8 family serine peptidase n=1 Tax=Rhodanobacter TaxID=75309 RepID=UPI000D3C594A|nr:MULTISPECIES: S8 family serine peptidase [Rhodanobacter]MBQ4853516.1 S8 family serine peptidase [Rhodanobacter sp. B2A1Ga4]